MKRIYFIFLITTIIIIMLLICFLTTCKRKHRYEYMIDFYTHLKNRKTNLIPKNNERLDFLIETCKKLGKKMTPLNALCIGLMGGEDSSYGYSRMYPNTISLPRDFGADLNVTTGWYFIIANLWREGEKQWYDKPSTVVYVIKHRAIVPKFIQNNEDPIYFQVVSAYASVTFPEDGIRSGKTITEWGNNVKLTSSEESKNNKSFLWQVKNNYIKSENTSPLPGKIYYKNSGIEIDLDVVPKKNLFLQGDKGCLPCISGLGYKYFSWPISIASGKINNGEKSANVNGVFWLDHQYGSGMDPRGFYDDNCLQALSNTLNSSNSTLPAWNWFEIQLENNIQFTASLAAPAPNTNTPQKVALFSIIPNLENVDNTKLTEKYDVDAILNYTGWKLAKTGTWYATGVTFTIDKSPLGSIFLQLTPTTMNQIGFNPDGTEYFEGGCTVIANIANLEIRGVAALEMVGWQNKESANKILLQNSGAQVNENNLAIISKQNISTELLADSTIYLLDKCQPKSNNT